MSAVERYHEHCRMKSAKQKELEGLREKYERQIRYFTEQLDIAETLNNTQTAKECREALRSLQGLADKNQEELDSLAIEPFAEAALEEIVLERRKLESQLQELYSLAVESQLDFIDKLTRMGELVRESENLQYASMPIAKVLRQNPVAKLWIGEPMQFEISGAKVRELLKV